MAVVYSNGSYIRGYHFGNCYTPHFNSLAFLGQRSDWLIFSRNNYCNISFVIIGSAFMRSSRTKVRISIKMPRTTFRGAIAEGNSGFPIAGDLVG